jgi:hypothetical protein
MEKFVRHGFRKRLHSAQGFSGGKYLLQQGYNPSAELGSDHQVRPGRKQHFPLQLGQAAAENQEAVRMLPLQFPGQLQAFFIAGAGDGAGVEQVDIGRAWKGDGQISGGGKKLFHGLGVILIDFASECVKIDSFHNTEILTEKNDFVYIII